MTLFLKDLWPSVLTAFLVSAAVSRLLAYLYVKKGWCAPSRTGGAMPLTGGIGILLGLFFGFVVFWFTHRFVECCGLESIIVFVILLGLGLPVFLLGLLDDTFHFKPIPKLFLFFLAAIVQFLVFIVLFDFFSCAITPPLALLGLIMVLAIFFFSNSYNFLDNANGHCAIAAMGALISLFSLGDLDGSCITDHFFLLLPVFAIMGFLVWNFPMKPKLFLGDAGSLFLGTMVVVLTFLRFVYSYDDFPEMPCKVLTILAFPLYDTCAVMLLRIRRGQNPTIGGQDHYSHRLLRGSFPLWLVNLIAFTAAGILPVLFIKLPKGAIYFGPVAVWVFLLIFDVLAALLAKRAGNSSEVA